MGNPSDFFECQKCGECCKGYGGTFLGDRDIDRISAHLEIDKDFFLGHYCAWSGGRPLLKTGDSGYCIFWDGLCTIHEVKPRMCKIWPFIESVLVDPTNWAMMKSVCPGIREDGNANDLIECVKRALDEYDRADGGHEGALA